MKWQEWVKYHRYFKKTDSVGVSVLWQRHLRKGYNKSIGIIQGESGSPSRSGGAGALWRGFWTPKKQANQLARHTIADLMTEVLFTSYFSCMDMVEALGGTVGDKASHLDYAYFGILEADFDENGNSAGEYKEKLSYYVLQNIASVFAEEYECTKLPVVFFPQVSERIFGTDLRRTEVTAGGFKRENGTVFAYWNPTDIMTSSYEGTISFEIHSPYDKVTLIDVMDGNIYEIPDEIMKRDAFGTYTFTNMPVKDTPLLLVFGEF